VNRVQTDPPVFTYTFVAMPPSAVGRRWRWQLFLGDRLLAGGWQLGERRALGALRTAASRATHELAGVKALRPDLTEVEGVFRAGARATVRCGAFAYVLEPRELEPRAARAA
jgi:hypothetical protein